MNGENKSAIIQHRIDRAKEAIEDARLALDNDKLRMSSNRIYYSIFYIISALALKSDFSTSKHKQLMGWFNLNFIKSGIISVELWKTYKQAFDIRQESDYEDFTEFEKADIEKYFEEMLVFVAEIEKIIIED